MKKIIVAALSVILGTFGYTVVDQAIEDRVANLEAKVSIQQSIIDELNIDDSDLRLAADMPIGSTMPCIPSEPTTYKLEDGTEVLIERFTNTVVEHRPLGEFGSGGFAHSCYEVEISGKTDPLYSGCTIYFVYVDNTEAVNYGCESIINSDGSFCAKSIPRGFTREFISEIREIWISGTITSSSSTTTPTTYPNATTTRPTLTTRPTTITTTIPFETTTTALNVEGGYCGDYATWKIENGTLIISGTGAMYDYPDYWNDYKYEIKSIIIENGITNIGRAAFYNFTNLTSVSLPDSLTSIGITAFSNCTNLTYITIPSNVSNIGWGAFYKCTSLNNITIPKGITSINTETFYGCTALTNITIPDNVIEIHSSAFSGCTNLINVSIGNNVESIGEKCFYNCTNLKTVYVGSGIMTVGEMAFAGCGNIADVYYAGTQEQWNAITFEASNARLTDATIHFENL